MAAKKNQADRRVRVTPEKLMDIKRLFREGWSVTDIAREVNVHRHTVKTHLKEKMEEIVADEARKQVWVGGLQEHFRETSGFARKRFKSRYDASVPEVLRKEEPRSVKPVYTDGLMGIPCKEKPRYMAREWERMYRPLPRYQHQLRSLREHTPESELWTHCDRWQKKVSAYEKISKEFLAWLETGVSDDPPPGIGPAVIESFQTGLFGNILRVAAGWELYSTDVDDSPSEGGWQQPLVKSKESEISRYIEATIEAAKKQDGWPGFESAARELLSQDSQRELRRIAGEIDFAVAGIGLMKVFPNRCPLCPV